MSEYKIQVKNLHKAFGKKVVLDGVDIEIKKGESLVVIGGSGTGKSVLIKCIQGLLNPDEGSIKVDGVEINGADETVRDAMHAKMGMLFQGGALFDSLSVWENVAFGLIENQKWNRKDAKNEAVWLPTWPICRRANFPAVCRNASVWPGRLPPNRKSSFLTSRPRDLTRLWRMSSTI